MRIYARIIKIFAYIHALVAFVFIAGSYFATDLLRGGTPLNKLAAGFDTVSIYVFGILFVIFVICANNKGMGRFGPSNQWELALYGMIFFYLLYCFFFVDAPTFENGSTYPVEKLRMFMSMSLFLNYTAVLYTRSYLDQTDFGTDGTPNN